MRDARSNAPAIGVVWPVKVKRRKFTCRPFFILSLTTIFLFNALGGDLLINEVRAAGIAELTSVGSEKAGVPAPLKDLNAGTFNLPRELGHVQESVSVPDSKRTVIHIQDAHCNYAAQKSIAEILGYLTQEYGIHAVNCEGGKGSYDLSPFTSIQDNNVRQKTSDFFVKEGVVNAAEYFAANNPQKVKLWGVEDADLYIKNLKIYRDSLSHKDEVDKYIKSVIYVLDNLKRHIYSEELLELDSYYTRYKDDKIPFKEYVAYLIKAAQKKLIDIKSFSNMYILSQTLQEEDKINFKKANNEKDEVIDKLKKILSKNELEELIVKVGYLKIERISQADFYAYLVKKASSVKLDISGYSQLHKYIIYISMYNAIDRTKITQEMDTLEEKIRELLCENDTQRELGILSKNIVLTRNIFNISITRDDYAYYLQHQASFAVSNYVNFIDAKAPLYKIQARLDKNISNLDEYRESMEKFYECSLERDKAFIKNIKFTDNDRPNSIIITGGFHTENLRKLFKDEKVSYISIMPNFRNDKGYVSPYMKRLAGQRTALEDVIDTAIPAVLNLQVVNILSQLAPEVEGWANIIKFRLAVAIMAAIIEGKEFILKIDADIPVAGTDDKGEKFVTFSQPQGSETVGDNMTFASQMSVTAKEAVEKLVNATLTKDGIKFSSTPVPLSVQFQPAGGAVPVLKPFAVVTDEGLKLITPSAQTQATIEQPGEPMCKAAIEPAVGIANIIRKNTATRIIGLVASDGDKALVGSFGQPARDLIGPDVHLSSYADNVDKGVWMPKLKELLDVELKNFVENDLTKLAPLMEIRIKEGADTRSEVEEMIKGILTRLGYQGKMKDIMNRIKLVQVRIESGKHTNPAVEFLTDISMLECYRYMNGDYTDKEMPVSLKDNFLTLLKLSVKNGQDFDGKSINDVLDMIFAGHLLEIKPADFTSFDEWNKSNRQLMQSV